MYRTQLLTNYFDEWIETYKRGFVRDVTLGKYLMASKHLKRLAPNVKLCDLTKSGYQRILNAFSVDHERQTVEDFHRQVHAAIMDAVDEGLIRIDPGRRCRIKGRAPVQKKRKKWLNAEEFDKFVRLLRPFDPQCPYDMMIYFISQTGVRFSEACELTPADLDLENNTVQITKTWNYKSPLGGFSPTKNASSVRSIAVTYRLMHMLARYAENKPKDLPFLFDTQKRIFNATANERMYTLCRQAGIPEISLHGLRHTHGSLLLYAESPYRPSADDSATTTQPPHRRSTCTSSRKWNTGKTTKSSPT